MVQHLTRLVIFCFSIYNYGLWIFLGSEKMFKGFEIKIVMTVYPTFMDRRYIKLLAVNGIMWCFRFAWVALIFFLIFPLFCFRLQQSFISYDKKADC